MGNRSDREDFTFPVYDSVDDSDEFDDATTSELAETSVGSAHEDLGDADPLNESDEAPKEPFPSRSTDDDALEPGLVLADRFEIVDRIHSGGMGHVYKAIDSHRHLGGSDQVHVAIKMMRRSLAPRLDAQLVLEREATRAQCLSHPNIVNIFDFDQQDGQFYIVMEWLEGESVNELLRRTSGRQLAPQFALQVIEDIASGLQHAHSKNVVHADINPSNVFVTDTQEIKLLDFGLARYADDAVDNPDDRLAWATRTYASPEVLSGSTPTFADDIFSLACLAYRLLSGTHPFAGSTSLEAKQAGIAVSRIPGISDERWQILSRALSYTKSDRPNSASAFLTEHTASEVLDERAASAFIDDHMAEPDFDIAGRFSVGHFSSWLPVVTVIAVALFAVLFWLSQLDSESGPAEVVETASVPSDVERLLSSAAQAVDEQRFISPDENNARDKYLEVLALDPADPIALGGLRTISDHYVRQANDALRANAPADATAALTIAEDIDPLNPAVATMTALLIAQGDGQLANAQLAAARGDVDQANEFLASAERYARVDADAIAAVRLQLAQRADDQGFRDQLAVVDAHITAGRLTAPAGNNAQALLIELKGDHEDDARLMTSMERLGQRLLTRATLATGAKRFTESADLLGAADTLGVLSVEVAAARSSLLRALKEDADANAALARSTAADTGTQSMPSNEEAGISASTRAAVEQPGPRPTLRDAAPIAAATTDSAAIEVEEQAPVRIRSLSDLGIERYVSPHFPLSARRRGLTGAVEVRFDVNADGSVSRIETLRAEPGRIFVASAEKAVRQWRFAPRDEAVSAQVTLRFDLGPE